MLIEFTVANYRSIKNRISLSLTASPSKEKNIALFPFRKERILPEIMMIGSNGSGKSNILNAVLAASSIIEQSVRLNPGQEITQIIPYKFDEHSWAQPTEFEFIFTIGEVKYIYGFSATRKQITEEYLYKFKTSAKSVIFERDCSEADEFYFPQKLRLLNKFKDLTARNKLFLSVAAQFNDPECSRIHEYLTASIVGSDPITLSRQGRRILLEQQGSSMKEKILSLLKRADLSISDYEIKVRNQTAADFYPDEYLEQLDESFLSVLKGTQQKDDQSETIHVLHNKSYSLSFSEESEGTKNYFYLLPIILNTLDKGQILLIDELESSLHPLMVKELLSLFNNRETNPNAAQLIFTTHNILLLGIGDQRRDQIYLVEKDRENQETDLYCLSDFSPRKDENILKNYLIGRYGALPQLSEDFIDDASSF